MDQQTTNSVLGTETQPPYIPSSEDKTMALLSHVLTIACSFLAPLIIYLIKKDESPFVAAHARESLNFQITLFIVCVALAITIIGLFLIWFVCIFALILVIMATIRASEGKLYRYPFCIRLIK